MLSEELTLYTPLSLFAEIGGYVGLLLGVSIWNFAAWISDILESKIQKLQNAGGIMPTTGKVYDVTN